MNVIVLAPAPRSRLVTIIAWWGIASGVLGCVWGVTMLMGAPGLQSLVILAGAAASLATSLGLRERREWARRGLIFVLGYTVVMAFAGVLRAPLPDQLLSQLPPEEVAALRASARTAMLSGAVVLALFNGAIIAKLCTRRVREEFGA